MNIVKETRIKLELTQTEMAEILGKGPRTVQLWESQEEIRDIVLTMACRWLQSRGREAITTERVNENRMKLK